MPCCGSQRTQFQATGPPSRPPNVVTNSPAVTAPVRHFVVCFEYIGQTGLTAIGGATGRRYRFDQPGARVIVDPHDRPSLATVPNLRQV